VAREPLGDLADDMKAWAREVGEPNVFGDITRETVPYGSVEDGSQAGQTFPAVTAAWCPPLREENSLGFGLPYREGQNKSYYCGPASALIANIYNANCHYDNWCPDHDLPLTQENLAAPVHLNTDEVDDPEPSPTPQYDERSTGFGTYWLRALNGWWREDGGEDGWYMLRIGDGLEGGCARYRPTWSTWRWHRPASTASTICPYESPSSIACQPPADTDGFLAPHRSILRRAQPEEPGFS
jgi:hypothetical protein